MGFGTNPSFQTQCVQKNTTKLCFQNMNLVEVRTLMYNSTYVTIISIFSISLSYKTMDGIIFIKIDANALFFIFNNDII